MTQIVVVLKTDSLIPIDDSLIRKIKEPSKIWLNCFSCSITYRDVFDFLFIKEIIKLDFVEKDICFISDFNDFEYRSRILKESEISLYSFCRLPQDPSSVSLYKTYTFDSEDDCFDQIMVDYKFLEKRSILGTFE